MRALDMEVMQTTYGWKWPLALEKWPKRRTEWLKEASAKLKRHGSGMKMCKRIIRRRNSDLALCTWIGVQQYKSGKEDCKASSEWSKGSDVWWTIPEDGHEGMGEGHLYDSQKQREEYKGHHPS
jgi:hypothetical protein